MDRHPAIIEGHVAVVTGGASGIGLAVAQRLGAAGMRPVIADLPGETLDRALAGLKSEGIAAVAQPTDVTSSSDVAQLKQAAGALGPISFVMSNAGCEGGGTLFAEEAVWRRTLETNLWGAIHMIQAFGPELIASERPGAFVSTGSKQGITLPPGDTAYNVSKAALKALTESLSHDFLKATGSRVTAHLLIPGFTYTGFTRAKGVEEKPGGAWTPEQVADFMLEGLAANDFYLLCPDNEVDRETDLKRMRWAAEDIIRNRPALSRWHPDYAQKFRDHMG